MHKLVIQCQTIKPVKTHNILTVKHSIREILPWPGTMDKGPTLSCSNKLTSSQRKNAVNDFYNLLHCIMKTESKKKNEIITDMMGVE